MQKILLLSILIYGCTTSEKTGIQNHITKIVYASGYCHGECPLQAIEIDASLKYKYYGGKNAKYKGFFLGSINKKFWDSLNVILSQSELQILDTIYDDSIDDQSLEFIIYSGKNKKHIRGQYYSLPRVLIELVSRMDNSVNIANLKLIKDSIRFESTAQESVSYYFKPKFPPKGSKNYRNKT